MRRPSRGGRTSQTLLHRESAQVARHHKSTVDFVQRLKVIILCFRTGGLTVGRLISTCAADAEPAARSLQLRSSLQVPKDNPGGVMQASGAYPNKSPLSLVWPGKWAPFGMYVVSALLPFCQPMSSKKNVWRLLLQAFMKLPLCSRTHKIPV